MILSSLAPMDFRISVPAGAALIWAYTCIGGQAAVMKSDVWQFFLLAFALLLALFILLGNPACREALLATPITAFNSTIPPERAAYFLLVFGSSFVIGPMIFGRILSAASPAVARQGALWAALGLFLMSLLICALGIGISGLAPQITGPANLLAYVCDAVLPPWAGAILICGLLAAVISSADSCLLSAAMIWSNDIRQIDTVSETRMAMSFIAIASCMLVFSGRSILDLLLAASDLYSGGIIAPTLVMLAASRKPEPCFFLAAMACGAFCGLMAAIANESSWSFWAIGLSGLLTFLGTLPLFSSRP